jgi:hypothetical protein
MHVLSHCISGRTEVGQIFEMLTISTRPQASVGDIGETGNGDVSKCSIFQSPTERARTGKCAEGVNCSPDDRELLLSRVHVFP